MAEGMPPRRRRDPRAETEALRSPGPRPRLERSGGFPPAAAPPAASPPPPPPSLRPAPRRRVIADPAFLVIAVVEGEERRDAELLGAAQILAGAEGAALALLPAPPAAAESLAAAGADRWLALPPLPAPEAEALRLAALITALHPRHVLLAETERGGDLARRLAVATGLPLFPDVESLSAREGVRALPGATEEEAAPPAPLLTLRPERIPPYAGPPAEARPLPLDEAVRTALETARPPPSSPSPPRPFRLPPDEVPLAEAELVIGVGAGVRDTALFAALARALGARLGGSRVACDAGLLPREAQIGASGSVIAPRAYLAFGLSGAPQHLQGITEAGFVAAVNTDPAAPIMARADLAIPLAAEAVARALLARLTPAGPAAPADAIP